MPATLAPPPCDERFTSLVDAGRLAEAAEHAAHALGPRLAVWWGALSVANAAAPDDEPAAAALDAAVAWVLHGSEATRRAAEAAGAAAGVKSPAGAIAIAAFWSGGSISLPGQPEVAPPPGVTPRLVASAVSMASLSAPTRPAADARLRQFLRFAAELLAGENLPPAPEEIKP
ncbi:hypothetical protein [Botrimarina sp.]|uniref:DUF6931 family protein n=1 Tax=Botrimarina sp. TaxID=2795802 RepID=UPI0032EE604A